jgi:hypothetical protein
MADDEIDFEALKSIKNDPELEAALDEEFSSETFKHGYEIGLSFGKYETAAEAQEAFDNGEIEEWLEFQRPKTMTGWDEYYKAHPEPKWGHRAKKDTTE